MKLIGLLFVVLLTGCHYKNQTPNSFVKNDAKEILLIGTFHFNNPGADVVKNDVFDVMTENGQQQLEQLTDKIVKFKPTKIFTEWEVADQEALNKLYQKYLNGTYFDDKSLSDFYRKGEIFQLAFRVAKKLNHKKVYAIDPTEKSFDYPLVMKAIEENKQNKLKAQLEKTMKEFGEQATKDAETLSLEEIYLKTNTLEQNIANIEIYTELLIKAGSLQNSAGAEVVAQWYKRNLRMWANIQKQINEKDKRVMVLLGSGHTAILDQIVSRNSHWKTADLKKVLNGSYVNVDF